MISITATKDGLVNCEDLRVIDGEELKKLESPDLEERINAICKDLHISSRYIATKEGCSLSVIGNVYKEYNDDTQGELELAHSNFLTAIDNIELPENDCDDGITEYEDSMEEDLQFCKRLLKDFEDDNIVNGIIGVEIATHIPFFPYAGMPLSFFKKLLKAFIAQNER